MSSSCRRTDAGSRSGVALIVVLGLVSALMVLAVSFSLSMRMGSLGARRFADRARARNLERAGLVLCMSDLDVLTQGQTNVYLWYPPDHSSTDNFVFGHAFASFTTNEVTHAEVLVGAWSNFVPSSLWTDATNVTPLWREVQAIKEGTTDIESTNGRVAFVAINCSGFLDARILGPTNRFMALGRDDVDWLKLDDFFTSNNVADFSENQQLHRGYTSLAEMSALNAEGSLYMPPVSDLFLYSYDPDPYSIPTNYADLGNFDIVLTNKFNINSITNYQPADYAGDDFQSNYIARVTNLLDHLDSSQRLALAWSVVNLLDDDSIPQSDSEVPWREDYGAEAVPMINEIVLEARGIVDTPNAYAFSVETWFPFALQSVSDKDYTLDVMLFTNQISGVDPVDLALQQDDRWSFERELPPMSGLDDTAWFVAETPPGQEITFPVEIRSYGPIDPVSGVAALVTRTEFLPLGVVTYTDFTPAGVQREVTVTNRVWFLARVRLDSEIVDEAMGYDPTVVVDEEDAAAEEDVDGVLFEFDEVGGYEVNDPRFNGHRYWWLHQIAGGATLGSTNSFYTQDVDGQGLPIVQLDRPLDHLWEIGQAVHPARGPWNTIDLLSGEREASLLDTLMTHEPLEEPWEYGRVHLSTPLTNVLTALLSSRELTFPLTAGPLVAEVEDEAAQALASVIIDYAPSAGYFSFASLFDAGGTELREAIDATIPSNFPYHVDYMREQVIGDLVEKVSFRQNMFVVFIRSQALAGHGKRAVAETRRVYLIYRDAYSGHYFIKYVYPY